MSRRWIGVERFLKLKSFFSFVVVKSRVINRKGREREWKKQVRALWWDNDVLENNNQEGGRNIELAR